MFFIASEGVILEKKMNMSEFFLRFFCRRVWMIILFFVTLVFGVCCKKSSYVQFKGSLIEETTSSPVVGCIVQFSDEKQMYGYAISDENGAFDFIVEPPSKKQSYKLTMIWNENYPAKEIPIDPPLKREYLYDHFVVYDRTNPYSLPTVGGYLIHPTLPGLYTWEQAKEVCYNLTDYGYDDWYLPYLTEVQMLENCPNLFTACGIVDAPYWTSAISSGGYIYYTNFYNANEYGGVTLNGNLQMHVIPFREKK